MPGPPTKVRFQAALRDAGLPDGVRLVGFVLSTFMRTDGSAFPSLGTLAAGSQRSERQVRRALRELEHAGLVTIEQRPGHRSTYRGTPDIQVSGVPRTFEGGTPDIQMSGDPGHLDVRQRGFEGVEKDARANGGPSSAREAHAEFRRRIEASS